MVTSVGDKTYSVTQVKEFRVCKIFCIVLMFLKGFILMKAAFFNQIYSKTVIL